MRAYRGAFISLFLLLPVFLLSVVSTYSYASSIEENSIIIVFDQAHKQVLSVENYTKALKYLNESFHGALRVFSLNETLDYPSLSGVDLFIIPAFNKTFSDEEVRILKRYISRGGKVIILGLDYRKGRQFNPDVVIINSLLSDLDLNVTVRFNVTGGYGLSVYDPLSDDGYVHLSNAYFSRRFAQEYFNDSMELIVETTVLTVEGANISELPSILLPPQVYALSGDGTILYFESGAGSMICLDQGNGKVAIIGFGLSFSDIKAENYNVSWIDLGDNKNFWVKFVEKFLDIKPRTGETYDIVYLVYGLIVVGLILVVVGAALIAKVPRVRKEKKKEVKLSEILKKFRAKES